MGELSDVVAAATAVATVMDSNVARAMPAHSHAIPRSADPEQLRGWAGPRQIGYRYLTTSPCSRAGICSDNLFDIIVAWEYAGKKNGLGLFIKDAYVYCEIGSVGLGGSFTVTAKFNDFASWEGDENSPVAILGGEADIYHEHFKMTEDSLHLQFEIKGNGAGRIWR
ncbi:MAG: hypothetical protein ACXV8L_15955 [Ilumatobacteraceae bacterium]